MVQIIATARIHRDTLAAAVTAVDMGADELHRHLFGAWTDTARRVEGSLALAGIANRSAWTVAREADRYCTAA
jgi:hypothetical protein